MKNVQFYEDSLDAHFSQALVPTPAQTGESMMAYSVSLLTMTNGKLY